MILYDAVKERLSSREGKEQYHHGGPCPPEGCITIITGRPLVPAAVPALDVDFRCDRSFVKSCVGLRENDIIPEDGAALLEEDGATLLEFFLRRR